MSVLMSWILKLLIISFMFFSSNYSSLIGSALSYVHFNLFGCFIIRMARLHWFFLYV